MGTKSTNVSTTAKQRKLPERHRKAWREYAIAALHIPAVIKTAAEERSSLCKAVATIADVMVELEHSRFEDSSGGKT